MRRTNITLLAVAFFVTTCLWAQGRIGGSRAGSGSSSGQSGLGSAPGAIGGSPGRVGAGVQIVGPGSPGAAIHPRGYIGQAGSGVSIVERSQTFGAAGASSTSVRRGLGTFGSRSSGVRTSRSQSIPPVGPSIPPLEAPASVAASARRESAIFDFNSAEGRFFRRRGPLHSLPFVVVPYALGSYAYAASDPQVIVVDRGTQTSSSAEHVVTADPRPAPARPAPEPKVIEVQPGEPEHTAEAPAGDVKVFRGGSPRQLAERPAIYLVALKSGVIYTSREHWLEGETFHYITAKGAHQTAPLSEVDLDFTRQLNAERNMPFVLEVRPVSALGR